MTHDELRAWAAAHAPEMPQAVAVLALLGELAGYERIMAFVRRYKDDPVAARSWCGPGLAVPWLDDLIRERDRLRAALTPFALVADDNPDLADNAAVRPDFDPRPGVQPIEPTMADCRRAAELLKGGVGDGDGRVD